MSESQSSPVKIERRKLTPELQALHERLDDGDRKFLLLENAIAANTVLTRQIVENTQGFVAFADDLAGGTKFLCRLVKGVQFLLKDVIDPYWKPSLICFVVIYLVLHHGELPQWFSNLGKTFLG